MQGAQINSANTDAYGSGGTSGSGYLDNDGLLAGKMEYALATNAVPLSGGTLTLSTGLVNSYQRSPYGTYGQYTYQVIRVPYYSDLTLTATIAPPAWNDSLGGVIVLDVNNTLNFNGQEINVSGLGFRGGGAVSLQGGTGAYTDYVTLSTNPANASKGEGIAGTPRFINNNGTLLDNGTSQEGYPNGSYAQGAPGNAGGGGTDGDPSTNKDNSGGGGGSNGGVGGKGGNSWSSDYASGGEGGTVFSQSSPALLVMGGGGGAGTTNNATGTPGNGLASSGDAGGGIVIIGAATVTGTGTINANGAAPNNTVQRDGGGGGGAGGSVLIFAGSSLSNITVTAMGGDGNTNNPIDDQATYHGPGGGGGGGVIYANHTLNAASSVSGGANGVSIATEGTSNYGAVSGSAGIIDQAITKNQLPPVTPSCNSLPVDFVSVTAVEHNGYATVTWHVADEINVSAYIVERSTDGHNFLNAGTVPYRENNTSNKQYSFNDDQAGENGIIYYRIKQLSSDGTYSLSNIVFVTINGTSKSFSVSPNPANQFAELTFTVNANMSIPVNITGMNGITVWQGQFQATTGTDQLKIDAPQYLPNGVYIVKWFDGSDYETAKLVVMH
jgi:hypothetical protein